jgi:hypothetical protein
VTALTLLSGIYLVWSKIDLVPLLEPQWMALEMVLVALLILLASLYLFSRGEMLRGRGARKTALVAAALALLGAGVVSLPVMFASTQVSAADAWIDGAFLSPSGDAVVASVARGRAGGASPQVWLVPTDGSRFRRLTGRLTMAPSLSPDGEWLAYVSVRGALGMRSNAAPQVRAMRLDGRDDRAIGSWHVGQLSLRFDPPTLVFSPDGSKILASRWSDTVRVYSVQGRPQVEIALEGTALEDGVPFDWSPDGSEVLVFRHPSAERSGSMLGAVNLDTGEGRVIFETAARAFFPRWIGRWVRETPLLGSSLAVIVRTETPQENYEYRLSLVDLKDGTLRPITTSFCLPSFDLHRDDRSMVYVTCPEEDGGNEDAAELHRWSSDGTDEVLRTALDLPLWSLFLSPTGDRVLLSSPAGLQMLEPEGTLRDLGAEYSRMLGWAGKDRVVIHEGSNAEPHLQVVNVTDGDRREVFP